MPAPSTIDEFLDLVRKSGVVEEKRLTTHLAKLRAANSRPAEPKQFAEMLVGDGIITLFQAQQFLLGKWRRFTLGKYKVLERLGTGGMGSVYLCEHMLMRRRVAVKVLPTAKAEDPAALERFYREARAVAALDHPNIVRAYDIDHDENLHFLVMEHVDGSSLQEIIKHRSGPMDVLRAAHYIRQAALGLQHAHETATLVHRDIKPGNILVDRNGIVKILDMGLARFFHDDEDVLTKKYDENVLGTADYLAPEQALDSHGVDIRADVYSLGATFYFCLIGRTPFAEGTVAQKLIWHQTRAPKPIRSFRPEVPEGIVAIIERMMAKDAAKRFQAPQEVADALAPWTQTPIPPPPDSEMPQFSLAATRGLNETGPSSNTTRPLSEAPSGSRNKVWQVSGAPSALSTATSPLSPASPRPTGSEMPTRDTRPAATPAPVPAQPKKTVSSPPAQPVRAPAPAPPVSAPSTAFTQENSPPSSAANPTANGRSQAIQIATTTVEAPAVIDEAASEAEDATFVEVGSSLTPRSFRRKTAVSEKKPLKFWIMLGAAAAVVLPILGLVIYLLAGSSGSDKKPQGHSSRTPIFVGPSNPGGLRSALQRAKSGDRIVLQVNINEYDLGATTPNVTIEPEANRKIIWKCPANVTDKNAKLLTIAAAGVVLKGITLDGDNKTEALISIYSKCPGVRLENLTLRNSREFGVLFANCEGDPDKPVQLTDLEFDTSSPASSAVRFAIFAHHKTIRTNRFINLRNCTFNGPGKQVTMPSPTKDLKYVDESTLSLPLDLKIEVSPP